MRSRRLLTSLLGSLLAGTIVGCNAIVGTEPVQYRNDLTSESPPAAPACESGVHTQELDGDGGAPGTIRAQCATVVIDGATCGIDPADVGLSLGLDGHGWRVNANVDDCFGGAILTISGVDDAAYPQTNVRPFLDETSAWLATNDDSIDDAGVGVGPFSSSPSGSSTIEEGPSASAGALTVGTVKGSANVVSTSGVARNVTFDFSF
jgi:hypothetical protein